MVRLASSAFASPLVGLFEELIAWQQHWAVPVLPAEACQSSLSVLATGVNMHVYHSSPACPCLCVPSSLAGRVVFREFATPAETSGLVGQLLNLGSQLFGLMTGNPEFTDNASVSLAAVGAAAARGSSGSSGKLLLAMSETPSANYLVNPDDLSTVEQVCAVATVVCTALNCGPLRCAGPALNVTTRVKVLFVG